jgi:uncharacterized protein
MDLGWGRAGERRWARTAQLATALRSNATPGINRPVLRDFRWNGWNIDHIARHGVSPVEAEEVVLGAVPPYPSYEGDEKYQVRGQTQDGRFLQVVYVIDPGERSLYVIHARPLKDIEKRRWRRRRR